MTLALLATLLQPAAHPGPAIEPDTVRVELRVRIGSAFDVRGEDLLASNARVQLHRLLSSEPFNLRSSLPHAIPDPAWQSWALDPIPLAEAPVDAEGRAVLSVPREQASTRLFAVVQGPGLCRTPSFARVRAVDDSAYAGTAQARLGRTVNGRVLNTLGAPVPARIEFGTSLTPHQRFRRPREEQVSRSYSDGTFELDLEPRLLELTSTIDLFADAGEHGTGALLGVPLAQLLDADTPLTLQVKGPGVLRGRIVDSRGNPASNLWLQAQATGVEASQALTAAGEGAVLRQVWADADGAFEVRGLAPTTFRIAAAMDFGGGDDLAWLHDEPIQADGASVELVRDPNELIVFTGDGELPASPTRQGLEPWLETWPPRRTALLLPCSELDYEHIWHRPWPLDTGWHGGGTRLVLGAETPTRVSVMLVGGRQPVQHRTIELRPGRQELLFEKVPDAPLGRAKFQLRSAASPLDYGNHHLRIEPLDLPAPILQLTPSYPYSGLHWASLPPGRYRAVLEGRARLGYHGEFVSPRAHGRTELEFEVQTGTTSSYELEATPGGWIEVHSMGEIEARDAEAVMAPLPGFASPNYGGFAELEKFVGDRAGKVRLYLECPGRAPEPLQFVDPSGWAGQPGVPQLWPEMALGTTATAEMIPAGDYELVARLPSGRTWRSPVRVRAGETTRVEVTF